VRTNPRVRKVTFDDCVARANELRARGFTALRAGHPAKREPPRQAVSITEDGQARGAKLPMPRFDFYAAPVISFLNEMQAIGLLAQAKTRWADGYAHDVFWCPIWVACLAFGERFLPKDFDGLLPLPREELRRLAFEAVRDSEEAQQGLLTMFTSYVQTIQLALESAEMLGGEDAVQTILLEMGL
jgi:hypothetical protein